MQHLFCRELVGDPDRAAWLVANGMTYKRCRFVEEYTMIRRRSAVGTPPYSFVVRGGVV